MDLSNFSSDMASKPFSVVLEHPVTGEPLDTVIKVVGTDSFRAQDCLDVQQMKYFDRMSVNNSKPQFNPAEQRDDVNELLVACTVGWDNMEWNGAPLEFTKENARMIYTSVPFVRLQVNKAIGDRRNFFNS